MCVLYRFVKKKIGDRIAIMSNGRIFCCGSSLFLKRLYKVGYTLTISLGNNNTQVTPKSKINSPVLNDITDSKEDSIVGTPLLGPNSPTKAALLYRQSTSRAEGATLIDRLVQSKINDANLVSVGQEVVYRLPFSE